MDKYILVHGIRIASDYKDFVPETFGRLTTLGPRFRMGVKTWQVCTCSCGNPEAVVIRADHLPNGNTRSCGCLQPGIVGGLVRTHGLSHMPEYGSWSCIIHRCTNANDIGWNDYGGRGVAVCSEWSDPLTGFETFLRDVGPRPSARHTIDRKDVNKGYCPENCKWATYTEQARNRRNNTLLTAFGKTQCMVAWAEETGINYPALCARLTAGWELERALTTPVRYKRKNK